MYYIDENSWFFKNTLNSSFLAIFLAHSYLYVFLLAVFQSVVRISKEGVITHKII